MRTIDIIWRIVALPFLAVCVWFLWKGIKEIFNHKEEGN